MVKTLTFGEELTNSLTHGISCLAVLIMFPIVSIIAWEKGSIVDVVGVSIFSICIFWMFLNSTLYHTMAPGSKHKEIMRIMDHISIYIAIAGTYTPLCLSVIGGWQAIVVLIIQWSLVVFGIVFKILAKMRLPKVSVTIYLLMGWTVVMVFPAFWHNANPILFWLIFAGGLCYSAGVIPFTIKNKRYTHSLWHIFVMAGAICHYIGICFFLY
ncbi:MAG: hemolysin III family protein [Clostridiales bacterium]